MIFLKNLKQSCIFTDMTAKVDANSGKITEYWACIKLSFGVEH
jgi:hypothetical protein